jgi:hypothetical protein
MLAFRPIADVKFSKANSRLAKRFDEIVKTFAFNEVVLRFVSVGPIGKAENSGRKAIGPGPTLE